MSPLVLMANSGGGPWARTGAFGEPGCEGAGCHRPEPLTPIPGGRVTVTVGPYVPGQRQRIAVTVTDSSANRWGFQLAAREMRNPLKQAGAFSKPEDDNLVYFRCASATELPCNNELEYAGQTSLGARERAPAGFMSFYVDWTAPTGDVGEVVFTASGVGADGDRGTGGDRSYVATARSVYAPTNQPSLNTGGVVLAAGYGAVNGISEGAILSLFGQKLAAPGFSRELTRADLVAGRLPVELSRIGIDFFLPGMQPIPAYILFVKDSQLNIQAPELPPGFRGPVEIQPVFNRGQGPNEVRGNRVSIDVRPVSPGLFTFSDNRTVAAIHSAAPGGVPVGRTGQFPNSRPARPGDVILVYGTGFGLSTPAVEPGSLASGAAALINSVNVRIGTLWLMASDILYAGAAPSFAGLQQFNIRIPQDVTVGDQPIILAIGGLETQPGVFLMVER